MGRVANFSSATVFSLQNGEIWLDKLGHVTTCIFKCESAPPEASANIWEKLVSYSKIRA